MGDDTCSVHSYYYYIDPYILRRDKREAMVSCFGGFYVRKRVKSKLLKTNKKCNNYQVKRNFNRREPK